MNRSRFRLLVTMSTGLVMIHVVCGAEIPPKPLALPTHNLLQSPPRQDSGVGSRKVWGPHWGAAWNGGTPVQQVVCLTRACREISREFPSLITLLPRSTEIGGKNKEYLPEDLIVLVCTLTAWLLFGRKRILGEQQSIE